MLQGFAVLKCSFCSPFNLDPLFISLLFLFPPPSLPTQAPVKQIIEGFSFPLNYLSAQRISFITTDCGTNVGQDSGVCYRHKSPLLKVIQEVCNEPGGDTKLSKCHRDILPLQSLILPLSFSRKQGSGSPHSSITLARGLSPPYIEDNSRI